MRFPSVTSRATRFGLLAIVASVTVLSLTASAPAATGIPNDCATARAQGITQTDIEIAADVAKGADAVLEAVPMDAVSTPVRIAAVAVWAVPTGILRTLEHSYNIAQACDDNDHQDLVKNNLDVKVSTLATQSSLNSLQTTANTINTNLNTANTTLNTVNTNLNTVNTSVNSLVTNLNSVKTTVTSSGNALTDFAALNLRLMIEENLAGGNGTNPIALFVVPAAQGGYIELVRTIVADTLTKMQALGQPMTNATAHFAKGDSYMAQHKYKLAYWIYAKAYQDASKVTVPPGNP